MDKKYINFYKKFILQTKTVSNGGISASSDFASRINDTYLTFMEEAYKHDQTFQLKKFDLRRAESAIKSLEFYFDFKKDHEDWYVGSHDREKDEEEMRLFQKVLLETINSINRSFNAEEKKEIERLRNLCQKEV